MIGVTGLIFLLSGCLGNSAIVPVYNKSFSKQPSSSYHVVHRGETLYAIAFRYNLSFKQLATANNIDTDYVIYPGQKLRIRNVNTASKSTVNKSPTAVKKSASVASKKTTKAGAAKKYSVVKVEDHWGWPIKGGILKSYSTKNPPHKGVDIKAAMGDSVTAARSGTVVYAGNSLRGYGNLIIVKHDDIYLSAYGYNSRLLVKEGQSVKKGQKIAEAGASAGGAVRLHFEIRSNGKPVNPLYKLPKR
ncbi:peptidoglycan DD-metalloendopeptidase family protein [Sinobacterium norvegicum]|uniref:peptidoglycan DD-metalloendopeptidase family protein n=1 Tax=Sinobacterium norvegicum TaxID=1641715 RepID=UPI001F237635|nr:peptidoglycan DD-metalloendopeptidase family protein [Sinobacterium norvegicum]